jgi:DNA-binding HxlR family transcriptional regulator
MIIIYWLAESPRHFAGLRQLMPGVSAKVLSQQLRELEADGILERTPTGPAPAPVVYSLNEYGASVLPLMEDVRRWGHTHLRRSAANCDPSRRPITSAAAQRDGA